MLRIAINMLLGERVKFLGILVGIAFASLMIQQQWAVFRGLNYLAISFFADTAEPDIWVMDETVQFLDDINPLPDKDLWRVRGVEGVDWAVPFYRGAVRLTLPGGNQREVWLNGLDDATLLGAPPKLTEGKLEDLNREDAVIVTTEAIGKLTKATPEGPAPLEVGDVVEVNDHRSVIVGFAETQRTVQSEPSLYTTYSHARRIAPQQRKMLSYVLVKVRKGENVEEVAERISELRGLKALTTQQFADVSFDYWYSFGGAAINFQIAVVLAFIVGTAIAGLLFYTFVLDNLRFMGTFKAMGARNGTLLSMILVQAFLAGSIGYGLGTGVASLFGITFGERLIFRFQADVMILAALGMTGICFVSALLSMRQVIRLSPAEVFQD